MFDSVKIYDPEAESIQTVGPWFRQLGEITDYSTGRVLDTTGWEIGNRQAEVEWLGIKGHIDAITGPRMFVLWDNKTMPGMSWDRSIRDDLLASPFSREYVFQLHFYRRGWEERIRKQGAGPQLDGMALLLFNKENSKVAYRWIDYDQKIVAEIEERLSWSRSKKAPAPDWAWLKGDDLPLRCRYCPYRDACAIRRGVGIELGIKKGRPCWTVIDKKEETA